MHQIPKLKCFSSRLAGVFPLYIEAKCCVENEGVVGAAPTGDAPTTSEWSTIELSSQVHLILETLRYTFSIRTTFPRGHLVQSMKKKYPSPKCVSPYGKQPFTAQTANRAHRALTHWGWVGHICVDKLTIIGSDNGLAPSRRQAIIWSFDHIMACRLDGAKPLFFFEPMLEYC